MKRFMMALPLATLFGLSALVGCVTDSPGSLTGDSKDSDLLMPLVRISASGNSGSGNATSSRVSGSVSHDDNGNQNANDNAGNTNGNDNAGNTNGNDNAGNTNANDNAGNTNANDNGGNVNGNDNAGNTNANDNAGNTNANDNAGNTNANDNGGNVNGNDNAGNTNANDNAGNTNGNGNANGNDNGGGGPCPDGSLRISTSLRSGSKRAEVEYRRLASGCERFRVKVEGYARATYDVVVAGTVVAQVVVGSNGKGEIDLSFPTGSFPNLAIGDSVTVGSLSGALALDCSADPDSCH